MIGRQSFDSAVDVGSIQVVERYANENSRFVANKYGEATKGKVWFVPGEVEGYAQENIVFRDYKGAPDREQPIAAYAMKRDERTGVPVAMEARYFDSWGQRIEEMRDDVRRYGMKEAYKRYKSSYATIVNTQTIDATKSQNILDRVLGLQTRNYLLQSVVTIVPAPNLVLTVDEFTEGSVQAKVPELKSPQLVTHSETRTVKTLWKNVAHLAESEEARLMGFHNTMALRQDRALRDMQRLLNDQIKTELETADATGGNNWGTLNAGTDTSTNDPTADIQPRVTAIRGNGFNVDYMAMHDKVAARLSMNSFIRGGGAQGLPGNLLGDRFTITGLPPVTVDQALTATIAIIGSRDAVWLGRGPTVVAAYDEDVVGYSGWMVKEWVLPYKAQNGAIQKLTGIAS